MLLDLLHLLAEALELADHLLVLNLQHLQLFSAESALLGLLLAARVGIVFNRLIASGNFRVERFAQRDRLFPFDVVLLVFPLGWNLGIVVGLLIKVHVGLVINLVHLERVAALLRVQLEKLIRLQVPPDPVVLLVVEDVVHRFEVIDEQLENRF